MRTAAIDVIIILFPLGYRVVTELAEAQNLAFCMCTGLLAKQCCAQSEVAVRITTARSTPLLLHFNNTFHHLALVRTAIQLLLQFTVAD